MCLPSSCWLKFAVTFTVFDKMQEKEVPINQDIKCCGWCSLFWRHDTQKVSLSASWPQLFVALAVANEYSAQSIMGALWRANPDNGCVWANWLFLIVVCWGGRDVQTLTWRRRDWMLSLRAESGTMNSVPSHLSRSCCCLSASAWACERHRAMCNRTVVSSWSRTVIPWVW